MAERELEALFGRALSPTTGVALGSPWRSDAVTGYDLTFSAPKSVSTLWALGDARTMTEIDAAHAAAVNASLGYLEVHASLSRRGRDGVEQIGSAGFAAACFDHRTSRTGDPQLHTHALVVNKVRCVDGAWRTLDGHEIFHHKKSAGVDLPDRAARGVVGAVAGVVRAGVRARSGRDRRRPRGTHDRLVEQNERGAGGCGPDDRRRRGRPGSPGVSAAERARIIKTAVLSTRPAKDAPVPDGDRRALWAAQAAGLGFAADAVTDSVQAANAPGEKRAGAGGVVGDGAEGGGDRGRAAQGDLVARGPDRRGRREDPDDGGPPAEVGGGCGDVGGGAHRHRAHPRSGSPARCLWGWTRRG